MTFEVREFLWPFLFIGPVLDTVDISGKRIIVAVLHWGLGHASRCIPIIHHLLDKGNTIAIASDGDALLLLRGEFPDLPYYTLPPYGINYKYSSMLANVISATPTLLSALVKDKKLATKHAQDWQADIIISDNRLTYRSPVTHNIYITHQLHVQGQNKLETTIASTLHRQYYQQYDECFVPDYAGDRALAGELSSSIRAGLAVKYIGPVSRLTLSEVTNPSIYTLAILSGPEPQRTVLEKIIVDIARQHTDRPITIVRGTTTAPPMKNLPSHISQIAIADTANLQDLIVKSKHIVCRAGYSSIMDLIVIGRGATIVPTPGQTEQEYLASRLHNRYGLISVDQCRLPTRGQLLYGE